MTQASRWGCTARNRACSRATSARAASLACRSASLACRSASLACRSVSLACSAASLSCCAASLAWRSGSWAELVAQHLRLFDALIEKQQIREVSLLVMESQALPTQTELLTRYQTTLDNDLYKALKALREARSWREARAALEASAVPAASGEVT